MINNFVTPAEARATARLNANYPIGAIYTSEDETSPAEIFGGTWVQLEPEVSAVKCMQKSTGWQDLDAQGHCLLSLEIPANCYAHLTGDVISHVADASCIMNVTLRCDDSSGNEIWLQNDRTTMNSGGGVSTSFSMPPQADPYTVSLDTYNYKNVSNPFNGRLTVLLINVKNAWRKIAN